MSRLSTDDPPILTAVAAGHAIVTAGGASADITVSAVRLPVGTVLWSNPGDGSGVGQIIPAVPSATGIADVFAIQNDGTVAAITADGLTAWSAGIGFASVVADFQGGLLIYGQNSITKLDGMTGQTDSTYTPASGVLAGVEKFSVPLPQPPGPDVNYNTIAGNAIIAGDGYFYLPYWYALANPPPQPGLQGFFLNLIRVNTAGESDNIQVAVVPQDANGAASDNIQMDLITNADTGVLVTWSATAYQLLARPGRAEPRDAPPVHTMYGMAVINGTAANVVSTSPLPNQSGVLVPGVQAQDSSFVGSYLDNSNQTDMVAFDASGNVRWTVPNDQPQIATDDGGVIGQSGITYDGSGTAAGQLPGVPVDSWRGNKYQIGSVDQIVNDLIHRSPTLWAQILGSPSGNSAAGRSWYFKLVWVNGCLGAQKPCGFYLYPFNPQELDDFIVDATSQATLIKSAALHAFKAAFNSYPVDVGEGRPDTGDHRANVVNGYELGPTGLPVCGGTASIGTTNSSIFYQQNMEYAQVAVPVFLRTQQDAQNALNNVVLMKAIGAGIGNNAAHEIGHQFFGALGYGMEDSSTSTYNGAIGCDPGQRVSGGWVYGFGSISWETVTANAWKSILGTGWHR